jgi:hypothetical protein
MGKDTAVRSLWRRVAWVYPAVHRRHRSQPRYGTHLGVSWGEAGEPHLKGFEIDTHTVLSTYVAIIRIIGMAVPFYMCVD